MTEHFVPASPDDHMRETLGFIDFYGLGPVAGGALLDEVEDVLQLGAPAIGLYRLFFPNVKTHIPTSAEIRE